jgi:hypothetical protein
MYALHGLYYEGYEYPPPQQGADVRVGLHAPIASGKKETKEKGPRYMRPWAGCWAGRSSDKGLAVHPEQAGPRRRTGGTHHGLGIAEQRQFRQQGRTLGIGGLRGSPPAPDLDSRTSARVVSVPFWVSAVPFLGPVAVVSPGPARGNRVNVGLRSGRRSVPALCVEPGERPRLPHVLGELGVVVRVRRERVRGELEKLVRMVV